MRIKQPSARGRSESRDLACSPPDAARVVFSHVTGDLSKWRCAVSSPFRDDARLGRGRSEVFVGLRCARSLHHEFGVLSVR